MGIVDRLASEGTDWSRQALTTLRSMSPSAVLWTFQIVRAGYGRTLPQCLAAELALTRHVTRHPDFAEGVRAMVVDKDRQPKMVGARHRIRGSSRDRGHVGVRSSACQRLTG